MDVHISRRNLKIMTYCDKKSHGIRRKFSGVLILASVVFALSCINRNTLAKTTFASSEVSETEKVTKYNTGALPSVNFTEPFANRWQRRFSALKAKNKTSGFLFFKHIRKAGGSALRAYFTHVFEYHNSIREFKGKGINPKEFSPGEVFNHYWEHKWFVKNSNQKQRAGYDINYVEQEFDTMDWKCPEIDPRWENSLSVITLRHPVERHMSEFFYSGPGMRFPIDRSLLYANETYTESLKEFMLVQVPKWVAKSHNDRPVFRKQLLTTFGRYYTDNFQIRALAGRSGDHLEEVNVPEDLKRQWREEYSSVKTYSDPDPTCSQYFTGNEMIFDLCNKFPQPQCPTGCDGPCFYPSVSLNKIGQGDLHHAIQALQSFDAVLLMETLDDKDQAAFLSSVVGVPHDASFSIESKNAVVEKKDQRDKTHFYR